MNGESSATYEIMPETLYLPDLPPRITNMILELLRHKQVLCDYHSTSVTLNCKGIDVEPVIGKLPLNSKIDKSALQD